MRAICTSVTVVAVLGFACPSQGTLITAGGVTQFYDNFEGVAVGNTPNNGANPGDWSVVESEGGAVRVVDEAPAEGSKYLKVQRSSGDVLAIADLANLQIVGTAIHAEWMMYIPSSASYQANIQLRDSDDPVRAALLVYGDGTVKYLTNPSEPAWVASLLSCVPDQWQKWTIDYTATSGGATFSFSIDDEPATAVAYTSDNVGRLTFGGNPDGSTYYVDAVVPEPSTIVMSLIGLIGLLAYAWRRRK